MVLTREGHVLTWGQPWPPGDMYIYELAFLFMIASSLYCIIFICFSVVENKFPLQ